MIARAVRLCYVCGVEHQTRVRRCRCGSRAFYWARPAREVERPRRAMLYHGGKVHQAADDAVEYVLQKYGVR